MAWLVDLIREFGFGIVFLNVLIEQLGAPIPAYPVLVITGALEGASITRLLILVGIAVIAALIADVIWYRAGKAYGGAVLGRICRISLSPDACIRQTESVYGRWGPKSLLIAKFVPGFASIAGYAEDSGEGRWTVEAGIEHAVPTPAITAALYARFASRQDDSPAMKAIAAMRNQFGGHAVRRADGD